MSTVDIVALVIAGLIFLVGIITIYYLLLLEDEKPLEPGDWYDWEYL